MGQAIAGKEIGEDLTYAFADCSGESNLYLIVGFFFFLTSPSLLSLCESIIMLKLDTMIYCLWL